MKQVVLRSILKVSVVATIVAPAMASASKYPHPVIYGSSLLTVSPSLSLIATSEALQKNDILMVQEDAIAALETGEISDELQSVINQWRAGHSDDQRYLVLEDLDVVEIMMVEAGLK